MIGMFLRHGARGARVRLETGDVITTTPQRIDDTLTPGDVVELTPHGKRYTPERWSIVSVRLRAFREKHA